MFHKEENNFKSVEVSHNFEPLKQSHGSFIIGAHKWPHDELPIVEEDWKSVELNIPPTNWYEKVFVSVGHLLAYLGHHTTTQLPASGYTTLYDTLVGNNQEKTANALISDNASKDPKIISGVDYKDVYFTMQSPLSPLEMSYHGSNLAKPVYGEIKNINSYGDIKWSSFTQTVDERYLPNLYTYLTVHLDRDIWTNNPITHPTFKHMLGSEGVNLDQLLFVANQDHKKWAFEKQTQQQDLGNALGTDYFQAYAAAFESGILSAGHALQAGGMNAAHDKHRNIVFTTDNLDLVKY